MLTLEEIIVGYTYLAKVSGKSMEVRIDRALPKGGWDATNVGTNKTVRIKNVRDITGTAGTDEGPGVETTMDSDDVHPVDPDLVPITELDKSKKRGKVAKGGKTNAPKTPKLAREPKAPKPPKAAKEHKPSGLDAAYQVLTEAREPMRCREMVEKMITSGLWKTGGKTPAATIYSAILREITTKGDDSRFKKAERGLFTVNGK